MPKSSSWVTNLQILALPIHPLRMLRWRRQTRKSGQESVDTSADDAKVEEVQREGSERGSVTTFMEVEEIQTIGSRRGSINMSTDNAKVDETQTTGSRRDSSDTSAENAEVEKPQTEGSKRGSATTSTENTEVEETQTMGHGSTSAENAKVDEPQKTGSAHESINMPTETAEVEERQTAGSGLVYNVCHRRRQRLDLASVAQLEQLEEDTRELQKQLQLDLESTKCDLEDRKRVLGYLRKTLIWQSCLKEMSERVNITLPPFPQPSSLLSSHMATLRLGDARVNLGINGFAGADVDSPEDHVVNGTANTHADPPQDHIINRPSAHANSSEGHALIAAADARVDTTGDHVYGTGILPMVLRILKKTMLPMLLAILTPVLQ